MLTIFVLYGTTIGTWSFQMATEALPFADRIIRIFNVSEASGLIEMASYCCIAAATANIAIVKTRGKESTSSRVRDIRLSRSETVTLIVGLCLLVLGAAIETNAIHQLTT